MKTPVVWTVAVLIESGSVLLVVPRISTNSDLVKMFEVPTVLEAFCFCRMGVGFKEIRRPHPSSLLPLVFSSAVSIRHSG